MKRFKKMLPYILFAAGAVPMLYFNWQALVEIFMMIAAGYYWQKQREK